MSRTTILSLATAFLAFLNTPSLLAQTPQQIEEALRNELKTDVEQATKDAPKLRAMGLNPDKDCPAIARLTGDDRKVFSKTVGLVTIKQYRDVIDRQSISSDQKEKLKKSAEDQAVRLIQACQIVVRIQEINAQLASNPGGSTPARLAWTFSAGDAAIEIDGQLTGGYPAKWNFTGRTQVQPPPSPTAPLNTVECEGGLDAPGTLPPRGAPGNMRCTISWGAGDKKKTWQCPEHAYDQPKNGGAPPRSAGEARSSSDNAHWFFIMHNCQGSEQIGTEAVKPQKFYAIGIRENRLGSDRDPPWK